VHYFIIYKIKELKIGNQFNDLYLIFGKLFEINKNLSYFSICWLYKSDCCQLSTYFFWFIKWKIIILGFILALKFYYLMLKLWKFCLQMNLLIVKLQYMLRNPFSIIYFCISNNALVRKIINLFNLWECYEKRIF
jgi:hypothetical protein